MNEVILVIIFVALLFIPSLLLNRLSHRWQWGIRLAAAFGLMVQVWFFAPEGRFGYRLLITAVVVSGMFQYWKKYRAERLQKQSNNLQERQ